MERGLVNKIIFMIAPCIIGGRDAITSVEGKGWNQLKYCPVIKRCQWQLCGKDMIVEGYL